MKFADLAIPSVIFAAAIILTAVLATATLRAAGPSTSSGPSRAESRDGGGAGVPAARTVRGGVEEQLVPPPTPAGLNAKQVRGKYLV